MYVSRCKTLLRFAQILSRSGDCIRFESGVFRSAAPHKFFKKANDDEDDGEVQYTKKVPHFKNVYAEKLKAKQASMNEENTTNYGRKNYYNKNTYAGQNANAGYSNAKSKKFYNRNNYTDRNVNSGYTYESANRNRYPGNHANTDDSDASDNKFYNRNNANSSDSSAKFANAITIDPKTSRNSRFSKDRKKHNPKYLDPIVRYKDPYEDIVDMDGYTQKDEEVGEIEENVVKSSKKSQNQNKYNHKLLDNPVYQTELSYCKEEDKSKDHGSDDASLVKTSESGKDPVYKERVLDKKDYPVYHFDSKLEDISDFDSSEENKVDLRRKTMKTAEGLIEYDLSADEFNVNEYMKELVNTEPLGPLETCKEDISDFGPGLGPTFNFAAYANKSELIQEYVKLGVKLYKVENDMDHMRALLTVDLKEELPLYVQFLHDCGVPADSLGDVITDNPMILKEDMDDMKTRIRYLRAHDFSMKSIARIVTKNPTWLTWATKHIDERLGHFQNEFKLTGSQVRFLATKQPKLITYNMKNIHENTFAVKEQMGFSNKEMRVLLLSKPRLWMNNRKKIVDTFDYLHNTMKLSHLMILSLSDVLTCRQSRLRNRHEFLAELKKVQYDPKKPGYISPNQLAFGSDVEFCRDVAKTSVETYNLFLKTR